MKIFNFPNSIKILFFQFLSNFILNIKDFKNSFFEENFEKIVNNLFKQIYIDNSEL